MRLVLVSPGSFKQGAEKELFNTYKSRIGWPFELKEIPQSKHKEPKRIKTEEGEGILKATSDCDLIIALDAKGKQFSSPEFAKQFEKWQLQSIKKCAFIIGGAEGISDEILAQTQLKMSFGPAIWPHLLCRIMLAEQIYRAWTILNNHPYHRE